jgi:hypothetical protein
MGKNRNISREATRKYQNNIEYEDKNPITNA